MIDSADLQNTDDAGIERGEKILGRIGKVTVADLVQLFLLGRKSGILTVFRGTLTGHLYFHEGRLVNALSSGARGRSVLFSLLGVTRGGFRAVFRDVFIADAIREPSERLLLEGLRRLDERRKFSSELPPLEGVLDIDGGALERIFPAGAPSDIRNIIGILKSGKTPDQLLANSENGHMNLLKALRDLWKAGVIRPRPVKRRSSALRTAEKKLKSLPGSTLFRHFPED